MLKDEKHSYDRLNRHVFYSAGWHILETRDADAEADEPEGEQPKYQYVWSNRYIDAAVLRDENTDTDGQCDDALNRRHPGRGATARSCKND